jgi:hypothetical protein
VVFYIRSLGKILYKSYTYHYKINKEENFMGTLEQTKVIQAINRLESIRLLLNEVSKKEEKYMDRFALITDELKNFGEELMDISEKMKVENLGKKEGSKTDK